MDPVRFVCTSDLHFFDKRIDDLRPEKQNNLELIQKLKPDAVLVAGDMTEDGQDGVWIPFRHSNQFAGMVKWKRAIEVPVHLCRGNHDSNVDFPYIWRPLDFHLVRSRGWLSYSRPISDLVRLVVLGENPATGRSLKFLKRILKDGKYWNQRFVLMWHYNLEGPYSDWWSSDQKDQMWEALKDHSERILVIVTGHVHQNWQGDFHGITQIQVGGPGVTLCSWDGSKLEVEVHED